MATLPTYTKTFHRKAYPAIAATRPELSLAGKTILITGGGSGIGAAIATTFAAAGAANILLMGRTLSRLEATRASITAAHPATTVAVFAGDVTQPADVAGAFAHLEASFGAATTLDALIANAGHLPTPAAATGTESSSDVDDWWRGFEVNVKGVFLLARGFARRATPGRGGGGGVFVNVATMAAHAGAFATHSAYAGSKAAAVKVVEVLQAERPDLRFVSAHPGVVETDLLVKSKLVELERDDIDLSSHFFLWLVSPEADFLRGKLVWVNWDVDELKARKEEIANGNELTLGLLGWA